MQHMGLVPADGRGQPIEGVRGLRLEGNDIGPAVPREARRAPLEPYPGVGEDADVPTHSDAGHAAGLSQRRPAPVEAGDIQQALEPGAGHWVELPAGHDPVG